MVSDTRSSLQIKDDLDGSSSKKKLIDGKVLSQCSSGKGDVLCARRFSRETASSRLSTPSPEGSRKSKRLEKETPPSTPLVKRKSERLEKQNTPSPLRRSDRGKKNMSSSSSGSQQSAKELKLSNLKRKNGKNWIKAKIDSKKAKIDVDSVCIKKNRTKGHTFKGLFKRQQIKKIVPDVDAELEGPNKLPRTCGDGIRGVGSEPMGKGGDISDECRRRRVGKWRDESITNVSGGVLPSSGGSLKGSSADKLEKDISVDNVVNESPETPDGGGAKDSRTCSSIREIFHDPERLPINCGSLNYMQASVSESSTCLERLQNGAINSGCSEKCMSPKGMAYAMDTNVDLTVINAAKRGDHNLQGTCALCSKKKWVAYDSPKQELCSCGPTAEEDVGNFSACEDTDDHGVSVDLKSSEKCVPQNRLKKTHSLCQMDGPDNVCAMCNKAGELLCCEGKGCNRCFHLCCLDPPLTDILPGVWHCPQCVKKKLVLGAQSVSEGVESIWDAREVEISNSKGMLKQKQYLVKYQGLAHIYNHWVSEKHLFLENPCVVSNSVAKVQIVKWNAKWTVPHRLLRKRSVLDKNETASSIDISECHYEWLVKWHDLSYDQSTWELDSSYFLRSALGLNLMKDYEIRHTKAMKKVDKHPKGSFVKLSELPASGWPVKNNYLLNNLNKLRECWFKSQNTLVFDNQERTMAVIFFIQSMTEICHPFLIVAASDSVCQWEAEFARLAPSVDVVVYSGSKDTRKGIRASEFYEEGGCVMLQVLLSSHEAVTEDLDELRCIRWEGIIIDEYQHWKISNDLGQIKMLATDFRIILISGQIKDTTSEYLNILSLLDTHGDFDKLRSQKSETNDNLAELKERLSSFVAYRRNSEPLKFLEYWVPARISNHQLEQYCATLLSNSTSLCSCLRIDPFGALRDILLTVRKCCDHPYLVDSSPQERLIAEGRPAAEVLDIGVKASGKLRLLDTMLTEIKDRGLKVLILYQAMLTSGRVSTGDILDDFLRQRFGQNTYERIDARVSLPKKQAAVNRFNKKETGKFVFLLENRACSLTIKLLPIDIIVIYDSDWNPANDLRALQKISFDLKIEPIKLFRLYSSYTVEERALILAKKNVNLDNNFQTLSRVSRAISDTLLMWGALYLFQKLDDYHATSALNISSDQSHLNEVTKEFQAILSESCESNDLNSVISKATLDVGSYSMNIPVLGEREIQLKDGEEPYVFWRNLLDRKIPCWKHLRESRSHHRKRVQYLDRSPVTEKDDGGRKRVRMVNDIVNPALVQLGLGKDQVTQVSGSKEGGPFTIVDSNPSLPLQIDSVTCNSNLNSKYGHSSCSPEVGVGESDESFDELESLHNFLKGETTRLCQILKLSEDVTAMVRKFLEYVIKNHKVSTDSPAYVHALQISLCWIAASILKHKVDKKDSLKLSKQLLNYQCTEEQANSVYAKMRSVKRIYLHCSENFIVPGKNDLLAEDISEEPSSINETGLHFSSFKLQNFRRENGEGLVNEEHAEDQTLLRQTMAMNDKAAKSEIEKKITKIKRKCDKRMKKLIRKQQEEIQEFHQIQEDKRKVLEADHRLKSAVIHSLHGQSSMRMDKLKLLTDNFEKKMEEHSLVIDMDLKDLEAKQLDARNEEREKAAHLLAEAMACTSELKALNWPQSLGCQTEEDVECSLSSTSIVISGSIDVVPVSMLQDQSPSKSVYIHGNDVALSDACISAPADAICSSAPVETLSDLEGSNLQSKMPMLVSERSLAVIEQPNQSKPSSDTGEIVSVNLPASEEQISDGYQSVNLNKETSNVVSETVPNEVLGDVQCFSLDNASNKEFDNGDAIDLLDTMDNPRNGPDEANIVDLPFPGRQLVLSEKIVDFPDHCGSLAQQAPQGQIPQNLMSSELHEQYAPVLENQSTWQIGVSTSEHVDNVAPLQSNNEASVTENSELLHDVPVYVSLCCNQPPAFEVGNDQGRSSFQTPEAGESRVILDEPVSEGGESLELRENHLDLGPASSVAELPNQAGLNLGIDPDCLHGPSYVLAYPSHQVSTRNSTPSLFGEPLQNELERIRKETEQLEKNHEDMMSQLKSDCEKKIQEIITHLRNECDVKLKETEAQFKLKKSEFDKNQTKVLMNKMLAEVFRSKCLDLRPPGLPGMQQGIPSNLMQHLHQLSMSPSVRASPGGASPCQHVPTLAAIQSALVNQSMQQLSFSQSMRPTPVVSQNFTVPPAQAVQCSATLFSSTPSRPPVISVITPSGNPRIGGEIRTPAPHLQSFRPASASSISLSKPQYPPQKILNTRPFQLPSPQPLPVQQQSTNFVSQIRPEPQSGQPSAPLAQQILNTWPFFQLPTPPPLPVQQQSTNFVSQIRPEPQSGQPSAPLALSAVELQTYIDNRTPCGPANHTLPPLPDAGLTLGSLETSDLGIVQASSAAETAPVCLSDDE